ncbi:MAG TPA: hypothetical protein PLH54_01135 [Syntrophales bacterium]|nr:hypothetical protein [Syntrophales bacterium]
MNIGLHGALVQWAGRGILLVGESGAGKTTCALEIARRGGVWVADDLVMVTDGPDGRVWGKAHEKIRDLAWLPMEGIFSIPGRYPGWRVAGECRIDCVVALIRGPAREGGQYLAGSRRQALIDRHTLYFSVMVDKDVRKTVMRIRRCLRRPGGREGS